jgi:hypothetical protein
MARSTRPWLTNVTRRSIDRLTPRPSTGPPCSRTHLLKASQLAPITPGLIISASKSRTATNCRRSTVACTRPTAKSSNRGKQAAAMRHRKSHGSTIRQVSPGRPSSRPARSRTMATAAASETCASRMKSAAASGTAFANRHPDGRLLHNVGVQHQRPFANSGLTWPSFSLTLPGWRRSSSPHSFEMFGPSASATPCGRAKRHRVPASSTPLVRCERPATWTSRRHRQIIVLAHHPRAGVLDQSRRGAAPTAAAPHPGRARPLSRRRAGGHGACPAGHDGSEPFEIKSFFGAGISGPRAPRFRYRYDAARLACRSAVTAVRPHRRPGAPLTNARHGARAPPGGRIDVTSSIPQSNRGRLRARMRSWLRSVSRVVQMRPVHPKRSQHRLAPQGSPVVLERAEVDQLLDVIGPAYNPSLRSLARPRGPARSSALRRSRPSCARQGNDRYASTSPAGVACGPASANLDQNLFL